jgi:hypothetical protein
MNLKDARAGWVNLFKDYLNITSPSAEQRRQVESRSEICKVCPELKHTVMPKSISPLRFKCAKCSCFFPAVVFAPDHKCPLGKW